jgi:hypothetical protein
MSLLRSKAFFTAIILVFGGLTAANAQYSPGMVMRANMPTSFVVSGKMLPAGRYIIQRLSTSANSDPSQLLITDRAGDSAVIIGQVGEQNSSVPMHNALVLKRVGGQYYLSKITYAGQFTGLTVPLPKHDREYIGRNRPNDTVVITTE